MVNSKVVEPKTPTRPLISMAFESVSSDSYSIKDLQNRVASETEMDQGDDDDVFDQPSAFKPAYKQLSTIASVQKAASLTTKSRKLSRFLNKCPTVGCDGQGNTNNRSATHRVAAYCPIANAVVASTAKTFNAPTFKKSLAASLQHQASILESVQADVAIKQMETDRVLNIK